MPNQSSSIPTLNIKIGVQIIGFSVLILVSIFLFFQGLSTNIKPELPLSKQTGLLSFLSTFLVIILIIITLTVIIAKHYRSKYQNLSHSNTNDLFPSNEFEFLKVVRNKIAIGL